MTDKRPFDDAELDALFGAARRQSASPSEALLARIESDALAQIVAPAVAPARPRGLWRGILAAIGGWQAATGLATAAVTGLVIGLATPDTLDDLSGGYLSAALGYDVEDLMPSYGDLLGEG